MRRDQLEHVIRAASVLSDDPDIVIVGSQAILGSAPDAPASMLTSMEADVFPRSHPDRADVIAFLNAHSDAPKPLPAAPAAKTDASAEKPGTGPDNGPQKAEKEPVLPASAAGKSPQTSGGDAGDAPGKNP